MSKIAEERYQSAGGLCRDLERCASEWREKREIGNFPLGRYDPSTKLRIPRKLYGRETDVAAMLSIFNEVAEGATALLLIAGYSGVGKSSLVHEMFLPITERRGFFLEGKFEQYRRDIPFFAWRQALDGFARFLLRCPEQELADWRQALQQAFYLLIPEDDRRRNHLRIARTLSAGDEVPEEWIFDAVNHLSHCLALVSERDEGYRLAALSRTAGEKANRTAAYETWFRYYLQGIALLPEGHWQERHAQSVALFLGAAEAAFLVGRFSEMEQLCQAVTAASNAVLDRIKVCEILVSGRLAQTRLREAMDIGLEALRLLGVDFPAQIEEGHGQTWRDRVGASLAERPVSTLIDGPEMTDQNALLKLRILSRLLPAVYKFSPQHLPLITAEMAMTSIEHGNTGLSAFGSSCHGMILVGFFGDYETAWDYALRSRAIIDRYGARNVIPRAYQIWRRRNPQRWKGGMWRRRPATKRR